jgi:hypothetical protein
MGALSGEYRRSLAKVIGHAKRLTKVPASLESLEADAGGIEGRTTEQAAASTGFSRSWGHQVHTCAIARIERELRKRDGMAGGGGNGWTSKRP